MLFDLKTGKRRRVVQVVFGGLAAIFVISFVGFGIGSNAAGGIFDALGIGGGSSSSSPQYDQQIQDAQATLETDPQNAPALLNLARYHYLSATSSGVATDPQTGATQITESARTELEQAVQAWSDYLKTKPRKPDVATAANAAQAYVLLADADGAAQAQAIVAESQRSAAAYGQLAFYYYAGGKIKQGDAAADKAVAMADATTQAQIKKNLDALRKQAIKQQHQIEQQAQQQGGAAAGQQQLQDPFGGLGGSSAPVTPTP
jgi:tetratricopeptide (TPR) repeat protein